LGQKRRFDRYPATSGFPSEADLIRDYRHVSNVPKGEVEVIDCEPTKKSGHPLRDH